MNGIKKLCSFVVLILMATHLMADGKTNVLNILDLGGMNDGSADISAIVNANTQRGTIFLPAGIYRVDAPLNLQNPLKGDGYYRNNVQKSSSTWLVSTIQCNDGSVGVVQYPEFSGVNVENLNIKCCTKEDGIRIVPCSQRTMTFISRVGIYNVSGCGVRILGTGSRPVFLEDITIFGQGGTAYGSTGMIVEPNDCRLNNIEIMGIQIGLDIRGGYTYGCNLHLWTGIMGKHDDGEWWHGTRGIVLSKNGIFVGSQIYPDTSYYVFEQREGNHGGFDISELLYYDDGSERNAKYMDGTLYHAEPGATPNLRIHGGIMAVCGTDEHPEGMIQLYTPGQDISNVLIRTDRKICGKNIDVLCMGESLPDYTVEYADKGWCRVADVFDMSEQGFVQALLTTDDGASWEVSFTKQEGKASVAWKAMNKLCRNYKLCYTTSDEMIHLYLFSPDSQPLKARFTTRTMTTRFRPVDYGTLRSHDFATRYREVLSE